MATERQDHNGRNFNVRIGHQTSPWSMIINDNAVDSNGSSDSRDNKRQAIRTFLHQKPHRVHQGIILRRILYVVMTSLAMVLAWAIGYYNVSVLALVGVVIVVIIVWTDQAKKLALITEQEIEMKVRRKKTVHVSETAEWVNLAINRWWMTCSDSVIGFLKDYIEPLLQEVVPPGIGGRSKGGGRGTKCLHNIQDSLEMLEFDLANQTPFVKSIQIFEPPALSPIPATDFMSPSSSKTVLAANMEIGLIAPDSKLTMKVRVGGKRLGYDTLVYVEGLHLSGSMQAIIHIDYEAPFPHIACISATFVRRPDLWFSVRVMKGLKVTDIPLVKTWVHSFVMNIFQSLLVDPGRLEIDLMSTNPSSIADPSSSRRARGVLTVKFSGSPPEESSKYEEDPRRWATFRLGSQKHQLQLPVGRENWTVTHSFLVYDLREDQIVIKVKHRRIMYTMELAAHSIPLTVLGLHESGGDETEGKKSMYFHNSESNISVDMEYNLLPPFSLNTPSSVPPIRQVAGVLYIHVHSATNLMSSDVDGLSDPYCIVLTNKTKVLTTHYILDTLNPKWERGIEIFVQDFTQASLSFLVYDWDGPLAGDDFLGAAKLNLSLDEPQVLQKPIELEIDGTTNKKGRSLGNITVSVVFRPVDSVAKAELPRSNVGLPQGVDLSVPSPTTGGSGTLRRGSKQAWKKLGGIQPGQNFGVLELSVVAGRNLVGMDRNGLSDPYVIVKYGVNEACRTQVISKTLNPQWNCNYTLPAPPPDVSIVFECWDKDQFSSDDFMGSLAFSPNNLQQFENGPQWCLLKHVQSGEVLLELRKQDPYKPPSQDSLSSGDISMLDEASKHLVERDIQEEGRRRSFHEDGQQSQTPPNGGNTPSSSTESSIMLPVPKSSLSQSSPNLSDSLPLPSTIPIINTEQTDADDKLQSVRRRRPGSSLSIVHRSPSIGSGDSSLSAHSGTLSMTVSGTDLQSEFRHSRHKRNSRDVQSESNFPLETSISAFYYKVQGEIVEANGLRGKLDHLELYIKIRLNSHPSYLRKQRFERGSVIHKTRKLRGSSILKWKESFMVKENPIPSDSLLTIDLKSGPTVTLGTHVITLDKMFEGKMSATKWLDLGNSMRVMIQMTRVPPQGRSIDLSSLNRRS